MTMTLTGPKTVKLSEIKVTAYVRLAIDPDRVLYFAQLYEAKVAIPPIIVTDKMELVEGRHRLEAMLLLDWTERQAHIVKHMPKRDLLIEALRANFGGAAPPTQKDIEYVIQQLLDDGISISQLYDNLERVMPRSVAKKYVEIVKKRSERKKVATVVEKIREGNVSIKAAATQYNVTEAAINEAMGFRKTQDVLNLKAAYAALETRVRGVGAQMAASAKKLLEEFNDGLATEDDLMKFSDRVKSSTNNLKRHASQIEERFKAALNGTSKGGD